MARFPHIIATIFLCGCQVHQGNLPAWVHLPLLPEGPVPIQPVPNETSCGYTLPDIINTYFLFPEGRYYEEWLLAAAGDDHDYNDYIDDVGRRLSR